jgi:4-hydroxy-2-oxoheptanedioate aldolase
MPSVPTRRLRDAWQRDGPALNAWLTLEGVDTAGLVATAGFDAVTLDLQHGAADPDHAGAIFAAIEAEGAVPLARPRWNAPAEVMRVLDLGARGVICPMVGSAAEAEALVAAARYPPLGSRSYGPVRGALGAGNEHVRRANASTLVFAMIETAEGFANLDDIASTDGLDGLYVGPADLSLGLGLDSFADLDDPKLLQALDAVVAAARSRRLVAGIHAPAPEPAARMIERGFRFVCPAVDADVVRSGAEEALRRTRRLIAGEG